ncbi:hypothetical protein J6TS2_23170 [Heyndrickxia sporothermodurans]|nr:hypothetical protein J6TS2_23170 [Heyndrickxia sporothermodurans]
MKHRPMAWAISALVYLGLVITGYSVYASMNPNSDASTKHTENDHKDQDQHSEQHQHGGHETNINPKVTYNNGKLTIELKDQNNQAPDLEVSHEKIMHLIVVSSDLKEYHHLHPEKKGEGVYQQTIRLTDNSYKVFVDIKPKGLQYTVKPIELNVGETHPGHNNNDLVVDTNLKKTINRQTVELNTQSFEVNKEITLNFDMKGAKPEKYLGALGHVVILDENGETFIHVHPVANDKTVFETQFKKPGVYKLWAEFKFGDQVNAYPFVIEVK